MFKRFFYTFIASLLLCSAVVLGLMAATSPAGALGLRAVNKVIDETNFIVGQGCSGTLVSLEERYILTAEHCVSRQTITVEEEEVQPDGTVKKVKRYYRKPLEVSQPTLDENGNVSGMAVYRAEIIGTRKKEDLALLQVVGPVESDMAAPVLDVDGEVIRGETVYIVGNPLGLVGTLTKGIISHVKRELPGASGVTNDVKFTQVDGGVAGGNSGGGIFNENGVLVSVLVRGVRGAGHLGFGVDIDDIREFLANPKGVVEHPMM